MSTHIPYPEEVRTAAIEQEYNRFRELRQRDIAFKELLLEYIAATGSKPEHITAADLVKFSNSRINTPLAASFQRLEGVEIDP
jgi:hypothetical protein